MATNTETETRTETSGRDTSRNRAAEAYQSAREKTASAYESARGRAAEVTRSASDQIAVYPVGDIWVAVVLTLPAEVPVFSHLLSSRTCHRGIGAYSPGLAYDSLATASGVSPK